MSNYVPHHTKKRQRLEALEEKLVQLLSGGATQESIERMAEDVRMAMIRMLQARRAELPPKAESDKAMESLDRKIAAWTGLALSGVVDHYRPRTGGT